MDDLLKKASETYNENFPPTCWFGRCIFLSWHCEKGTCKFCFRSTTKNSAKKARRSVASILTDAMLGKKLGYHVEFLTGGYGIFPFEEIVDIAQKVSIVYGQKIWINLGALSADELMQLKPYIEGVCASIETVEPVLHDSLCPQKPIAPYEDMLETAGNMGLKKSITIVIGLGEKKDDIQLLHGFIEKHNIDRMTFYALKPVKGTPYTKSPDPEYYAWWIAQTRIRFPKLIMIAGLTPKNPGYTKLILQAGSNAITKFPILKRFGSPDANLIESMVRESGRSLTSNLTQPITIDDAEIDSLPFDSSLKDAIKLKIPYYIGRMRNIYK